MSSITDDPPFGHTVLQVSDPGLNNIDELTWNNTQKRWEGTVFDIVITVGPDNYTAVINDAGSTNARATGEYASSISINNATDILYVTFRDLTVSQDTWLVEEITGAEGDPHIKPLFGKDYTI